MAKRLGSLRLLVANDRLSTAVHDYRAHQSRLELSLELIVPKEGTGLKATCD